MLVFGGCNIYRNAKYLKKGSLGPTQAVHVKEICLDQMVTRRNIEHCLQVNRENLTFLFTHIYKSEYARHNGTVLMHGHAMGFSHPVLF